MYCILLSATQAENSSALLFIQSHGYQNNANRVTNPENSVFMCFRIVNKYRKKTVAASNPIMLAYAAFLHFSEFSDSSENSQEFDYPDEEDVYWSDGEEERVIQVTETSPEMRVLVLSPQVAARPKCAVRTILRTECVICLERLEKKEASVCLYACGNTFHESCVKKLTRCPMCRAPSEFQSLQC